jgi:hypothetical protein
VTDHPAPPQSAARQLAVSEKISSRRDQPVSGATKNLLVVKNLTSIQLHGCVALD